MHIRYNCAGLLREERGLKDGRYRINSYLTAALANNEMIVGNIATNI